MRLVIVSAMWKRHSVFNLWAECITMAIEATEADVQVVVAGSEGDISAQLCANHGFHYVEYANKPLGDKFQAAADYAFKELRADYILVLGSDNVISAGFINAFLPALRSGPALVGHLDSYQVDLKADRMTYWRGYNSGHRGGEPCGSGRFYSRAVYDKLGGRIWPPGTAKSLDFRAYHRILNLRPRPIIKVFRLEKMRIFHAGLKSGFDRNPFAVLTNARICHKGNTLRRFLPEPYVRKIEDFKRRKA